MNRFLDLFFVSSSREDAILKQGSRSIHAVLLSKKKKNVRCSLESSDRHLGQNQCSA